MEDFGIVPVDYNVIVNAIGNYKSPKDKISKMEKDGELIRLKKGLFVFSPEYSKQVLSKELIANHLYGPSYVSAESALSHYSLIPERVYLTKSVCAKRSKKFITGLGTFEYYRVPETYFPIGIKNEIVDNDYAFLIATPEKALADIILLTAGLRIQSKKAMEIYLNDDLRIDFSTKHKWNPEILKDCAEKGRKKRELILLFEILKNGGHF